MQCKDQLHTVFEFSQTPKRIVSLVPSQTELLIDLGLKKQVVGITKFCTHPTSLRDEKTIVGGTKTIHLDKIRSLQPDIIICNKEENTKEIVALCATIAPVWVSDIYTLENALEMISLLGTLFEKEEKAFDIILANHLLNLGLNLEEKKSLKNWNVIIDEQIKDKLDLLKKNYKKTGKKLKKKKKKLNKKLSVFFLQFLTNNKPKLLKNT